jgi:hypothetical protein
MIGPKPAGLGLPMSPTIAFHIDSEKAAEDYLMNRMPADQIQEYEFHLRYCPVCANEVEVAGTIIEALLWSPMKQPPIAGAPSLEKQNRSTD